MAGVKAFKEKIIKDEAFGKKYANVKSAQELVSLASADGFNFSVDDVKNNTDLTEAELSAIAGGTSVAAKSYFVNPDSNTVFAKNYFVIKD